MKNNIMLLVSKSISVLMATILIVSCFSVNVYAENNNIDPVIMVSLGDSYSSGEGITPFYGQEKKLNEKVEDEDWLAHRSQKSWPSLLEVPGIEGTMGDYKVDGSSASPNCEWYFKASSGAETKHFNDKKQTKEYCKSFGDGITLNKYYLTGSKKLPKQLDVFNDISGTVDYVTLTIGGNDVDFAKLITTCVTGSTYLGSKSLEKKIDKLWDEFDGTKADIKQVYSDIQEKAGSQAEIIVAGYPKLLDKNGKGFFVSKEEATIINRNVSKFNNEIEKLVGDCSKDGMNIHFVDVETEFDKDGGHQAYSDNAWINKIMIGTKSEDIDELEIASAYSVHPNEFGAQAYARCVNAKIQEIENSKEKGTLSGKICKASDRISPIGEAAISVYKNDKLYTTATSDSLGSYVLTLPVGDYRIEITASNYISFTAYASVTEKHNTYMETFLLVEGSEYENGIAQGTINNALTGYGIEGVSLSVRKGWNNSEHGEVITSTVSTSNGSYSLTLPAGNYTMVAEKSGYITTTINIIVQPGKTDSQNGTISPIISGNNFRVVLTWGTYPQDLDSHVVGTLANGDLFHCYYWSKSQYDGNIEICNLDVDDTSSYGPETITLKTTNNSPYYYYIYDFSGDGSLATSEAQIKLYQGESLIGTFNVPTDQGDDRYWNVFAIVNGTLIIKNTISSSADLLYASETGISLMALDEDVTENNSIESKINELEESTVYNKFDNDKDSTEIKEDDLKSSMIDDNLEKRTDAKMALNADEKNDSDDLDESVTYIMDTTEIVKTDLVSNDVEE